MSGSQIDAIGAVAGEHKVAIHLDGARIFNACIAANETFNQWPLLWTRLCFVWERG